MPEVVCPTCDASVFVSDEMLEKPVACGNCGSAFVPAAPARSQERDEDDRVPESRRFGRRRYRPEGRRYSEPFEDDDEDDDDDYFDRRRYARKPGGDAATASMIIGILSLPMAVCCPYIIVPLAILAIILGVIGLKSDNRPQAIAGLVIGGISLVISIALVAFLVFSLMAIPKTPPPAPMPGPAPGMNWQPPRTFR